MIVKTEAIVLKSMRFRDTSKIVTFYSRRYGKIKGIAKGARDITSKFGGALEPLSLVSVVLYRKEQRQIQLISQCDLIHRYRDIHSNISKMAVGLGILELLQRATHDEEENAALFNLVKGVLQTLERADRNPINILRAFQLRLGTIFGYGVQLECCFKCARVFESAPPGKPAFFVPARGGAICEKCVQGEHLDNPGVKISVGGLLSMQQLLVAALQSVPLVTISEQEGNEIDESLRLYVQQHFDGIRSLRSLEMLQEMNIH
jgi:DNA repair protein RecO (recombination protein O)